MFIDVGLVLKVFIYIVGGFIPFLYNYYFIKKRVDKESTEKIIKENNKTLSEHDKLRLNKVTGEEEKRAIEPITLSNTLSLHYLRDERTTRNTATPLYVLLVIDQNTMNNPEALNKVISDVPKIMGSFENKK